MRQLNSGPLASSEALRKIAVAADQLGFGAVTAHDHVTLGPGEKYPLLGRHGRETRGIGKPRSAYEYVLRDR